MDSLFFRANMSSVSASTILAIGSMPITQEGGIGVLDFIITAHITGSPVPAVNPRVVN